VVTLIQSVHHIPKSRDFQTYFTTVFFGFLGTLSVQIQPWISAPIEDFEAWILIDNTEFRGLRFGTLILIRLIPRSIKWSIELRSILLGASTENIWWGPGRFIPFYFQIMPLVFNITFNTRQASKTFIGSFEVNFRQVILESSEFAVNPTYRTFGKRRYLKLP